MKKIFVMALMGLSLAACQNSTKSTTVEQSAETVAPANNEVALPPSAEAAVISFEKENYDFGTIIQGEKVSYSYKFKNVGKSPLIITDATATCGCTVPEVPKEPIKPGEEGEIKVVFDSNGKSGMQDKIITVNSNAQPTTASLHLTGEIKEQSK